MIQLPGMISKRALFAVLLIAGMTSVYGQVLDRPVAIVRLTETVNIGQRELRQQVELLAQQLGRPLSLENREEVLDAQISDVLLNQAAARANVRVTSEEIDQAIAVQRQSLGQPVSDAQFRQIVEQQMGMTWNTYVEEVTNRLVQEKFILERAQQQFNAIPAPTAREIRQVYEENAQQFTNPAMVRFDHIFFDLRSATTADDRAARQRAAQIARDVARGQTSFDAVMRQSLDDATFSGGDFGYLVRGDQQAVAQLGSDFVETVFDLEDGDISGVLESNVGLHVIRVTDRRSPRLLSLDDPLLPGERVTVRQQIVAFITNQRQQEIFQQSIDTVLRELRSEAEITRFEENLEW